MNYRVYHMNLRENLKSSLEAAAFTAMTAVCFYDSAWIMLGYPLVLWWYRRHWKRVFIKRRKKALQLQFRDGIQALAAALAAGYSAENAVSEAKKDLKLQGDVNEDMVQEFAAMQRKLDANQTLEEAMQDFAERSGLEEAETFAEVFAIGKRSGGDLIEIMRDTVRTISETVETERQVAMILAAREYEQKIMSWMPFAIVLYLRIGCAGFLEPLYHNLPGICASTLCLGIYLLALWMGQRAIKIEV